VRRILRKHELDVKEQLNMAPDNYISRTVVLICLTAMAVTVLTPGHATATGVNPNVAEGSDIVMKDMRWPAWDQGTYYCYWYVSFVPRQGTMPTFYGGLATKGPDTYPGLFHSFWGNITNIHEGRHFYRHGYGAEGSKGGANGQPSFLSPNIWYRNVLRIFAPAEGADKQTYIGWWIKDVDNNTWYTHSIVSLDMQVTGVNGNGGFVEALAPASVHRAFERRLGYCRVNGQWLKSDTVPTQSPQFFKLIENDTVLRYDRSCADYESESETVNFTTIQPDEPVLDEPAIESAQAWVYGHQVAVEWCIPTRSAPQLGYRLEVFDAAGLLLQAYQDVAPHVYAKRLDLAQAAQQVRLTVTDIFDQQISTMIAVKPVTSTAAKSPFQPVPGLKYRYYEAPKGEAWERLPDLDALQGVKQGVVNGIDDTIREDRENLYAMRYQGSLIAPDTGLYVIEFGSCDGSLLKLDGNIIADNDGIHGTSVSQYTIALEKGLHDFELSYFKGPQTYLAPKILLSWEGPRFKTRKLTPGDFACKDDAHIPSISMPKQDFKSVLEDNLVTIKPIIENSGHRIDKVQFFCGHYLLGTANSDDNSGMAFKNLHPQGVNRLWTRLWYDEKHSVDSDVMVVETHNRTEGPWHFSTMGESVFPLAVRSHEGRIAFRGDGFCFGNQRISGDFELTARVLDMDLSTPENGIHHANWLGIHVQEGLRRPFDGKRFGVYCLANGTVRGAADYPDLAGTYLANALHPADHRWLRVIRRGACFESYTSADGQGWHKASEHIMKSYKRDAYVGVLFRSVPGKSRSLFSGSFDNVTLKRAAPRPEARQRIAPADIPRLGRIAAMVQAGNANVLYARTIGKGILKSTDKGETWQSVDAGLSSPEALSVRSVAVHALDSSIVLRGSGCVADGQLKSGLHRSTDGGRAWKLVSTEIDFDGQGPSAAFGETISFSSVDPNLVAAAGETKGVFLSHDAGVTWDYYSYADERVTCLAFIPETLESRKVIPSKKQDLLIIGTCADSEFAALGLPKPASSLPGNGRVYWNTIDANGKIKETVPCDLPAFGMTNIAFGTHSNFATFATTRGLFYTYQRGNFLCQRRYAMPSDMLFTALGYRQFAKELRQNDIRTRVTTYTALLSTEVSNSIYCAKERTTAKWSQIPVDSGSSVLCTGITCILPDKDQANTLYVCSRQGIFKSVDGGKRFRLVFPGFVTSQDD
jgi:hypothetical protein